MGFHIRLGECNRKLPGGAFLSQTHCTLSLCILAEIINQEKLHGRHVVALGLSEDALVAGITEQHIHELGTTQKGECAFPAGLDLVPCLIQNKFPMLPMKILGEHLPQALHIIHPYISLHIPIYFVHNLNHSLTPLGF